MDTHFLTPLLSPRSVVVIASGPDRTAADLAPLADAASTESAATRALLRALAATSTDIRVTHLHARTTGTLADLANARADLAVIALPAAEVAAALDLAGQLHCRAALIVASGLSPAECQALQVTARRLGILLLGPLSLGFQRPHLGLNASALGPLATPGPLALVSQSGALTTSILDWAQRNGVGFSAVVSIGPNPGVDLPQLLDFLAHDASTQSILVCMEGIHNARRFMSALRAAAYAKPVVVMKAGRQPAGSTAALTHSAAIVGSDDVFEAALRRAGVVRVRSFTQLFSAAKCLASRFRPTGRALALITNGGGPAVLAADRANELGLTVAELDAGTRQSLAPQLPPGASLAQVIDLGEDATPAHYRAALLAAAKAAGVDGLLVIHSPKPSDDPAVAAQAVAQAVCDSASQLGKPLLTCWMGEASVREARSQLNARSIPTFRTPEAAVEAFHNIASFYANQQLLQQTPSPLSLPAQPDTEGARLLIEAVLAERRQVLTEMESKALLAAFHIPVTRTMLARSANEAMLIGSQLGYPVALKIDTPDISHKSDVQGVLLDVRSATQVRDGYNDMLAAVKRAQPQARINGVTLQPMAAKRRGREVYIGLTTDDPFGPVITFGAGGTMIELIADRAMELPPLNTFLAQRLIDRARVAETLGAWRGASAVDRVAIEQILLRVSEMVCALPQLREMDINPIIVDEDGAVAVDARIVVAPAPPGLPESYPHLAILPYPASQEREWPMKGGDLYTLRPIRPDDAEMLQAFTRGLSQESRYFRFASAMRELPARMLARYTLIDYDREMAFVAVHRQRSLDAAGEVIETEQIIGVSRYITNPDQTSCEFSLVVSDAWKGQGLGTRLMQAIMDIARSRGLSEIVGMVLANNTNMLRLMHGLGFRSSAWAEDPDFRLVTHQL